MGSIERKVNTILARAFALAATMDANQLTIELGKMAGVSARSEGASAPERRATPSGGKNDSHSTKGT